MWKAPAMSSPLLDAEQMVYSSSPVIPPFKVNPVVQESEYRRSFKGSPPPRGPRLRRGMEEKGGSPLHLERVSPERAEKSKKKKRKQLSRKLSQNGLPQCGLQSQQQEVRSQSPHESPLPSHGGYRKVKSEYNSNFRSPLLYRFKDGEWVKSSTAGVEGCDSHTWYRELRELREKAKAYRRRAWGTHFSREHLNQILSEQNRLWEASTVSSSATTERSGASSRTIQALDLASCSSGSVRRSPSDGGSLPRTPSASRRSSGEGTGDPGLHSSPTLPVQRKLAWGEVGPEAGPGQVGGDEEGREEEPQIGRTQEEEEQDQEDEERNNRVTVPEGQSPESSTSNSQSSVQRGRLATPKMKTFSTIQRTHHDLTTPATGGAILVSPPKLKDSSWRKSMRRSEPPLGKPHSPHKPMFWGSPESVSSKGKESSQPYASPAAGVTTLDPIPLREEPRPAHPSPPPHLARTSHRPGSDAPLPSVRVLTNCIHGTLRDPEFQHNGNLGFIRHGEPVFTSNDSDASDNDDRMSQMSARSAASCSLASQILERAQKRRKNFWGKG
ncbi:hypothetical protein AGOR_G00246570 [Albula goreensis]|uniref:Nuclear protein MDM1 n=1 Tax=Albula goreensis TaxID=1534307 RepID=A0A8T3CDW9_9TELE|nr:hypothetical protein AGOR_G00246570 [Albula goreensis]